MTRPYRRPVDGFEKALLVFIGTLAAILASAVVAAVVGAVVYLWKLVAAL